jgi:hypothetical protein
MCLYFFISALSFKTLIIFNSTCTDYVILYPISLDISYSIFARVCVRACVRRASLSLSLSEIGM